MRKVILFLALIFLFISCNNEDSENSYTGEFRTVYVKVLEENNSPMAFDSLKVFFNGEEISLITNYKSKEYETCQNTGLYPLVNDARKEYFYIELTSNYIQPPQRTVWVKGYKDSELVFQKFIPIQADKYHVYSTNFEENPVIITKKTVQKNFAQYV